MNPSLNRNLYEACMNGAVPPEPFGAHFAVFSRKNHPSGGRHTGEPAGPGANHRHLGGKAFGTMRLRSKTPKSMILAPVKTALIST